MTNLVSSGLEGCEGCFSKRGFSPSTFTADLGSLQDEGTVMLTGLEQTALTAASLSFISDMKAEP